MQRALINFTPIYLFVLKSQKVLSAKVDESILYSQLKVEVAK